MIDTIDLSKKSATIKLSGKITTEEIKEAHIKITSDKDFPSREYHLWVFDPVEDFRFDSTEISLVARRDIEFSKKNPNLKIAFVSRSPLAFGYLRMYETYAEDTRWDTKVFKDLDKAKEWLKL